MRDTDGSAEHPLDPGFAAPAPNRKWIAEGWLYVATVIDLFSRHVGGWVMMAKIYWQTTEQNQPDQQIQRVA